MKYLLGSMVLLCALFTGALSEPIIDGQGLWWVSHGTGEPLQIRLYPDGSAWSDYPANNPGRWRVEDGRIICLWADDWKEIFVHSGTRWIKLGYKPGQPLTGPPNNRSSAVKASILPDGWFGLGPSRDRREP